MDFYTELKIKVKFLFILLVILCLSCLREDQCLTGKVHITGEMINVNWNNLL
jgi:hypothetical protein